MYRKVEGDVNLKYWDGVEGVLEHIFTLGMLEISIETLCL